MFDSTTTSWHSPCASSDQVLDDDVAVFWPLLILRYDRGVPDLNCDGEQIRKMGLLNRVIWFHGLGRPFGLLAKLLRAWSVLMNKRIDAGCSYRDGPRSCSSCSQGHRVHGQVRHRAHPSSHTLSHTASAFLVFSILIGREFLASLMKTRKTTPNMNVLARVVAVG